MPLAWITFSWLTAGVYCGSSAALSISKRATASLPKSSFLSEVSAVAAATTMSNIVTAQNRLLQSGRPTTTTTPLRDIGTVLESCSCSVNAAGVRSCSCPDASPAEQTAVSAWLEVAEVMNSVSSLRLANKAPEYVQHVHWMAVM